MSLSFAFCGLLFLFNTASAVSSSNSDTENNVSASARQLSNITIDINSMVLAFIGVILLLLTIQPIFAFLAELFRRVSGGRGGSSYHHKSDDFGYYDDDYDTTFSRQRR